MTTSMTYRRQWTRRTDDEEELSQGGTKENIYEDNSESEREQEQASRWKNEMRKMENEITELKRKNKSLEILLHEM